MLRIHIDKITSLEVPTKKQTEEKTDITVIKAAVALTIPNDKQTNDVGVNKRINPNLSGTAIN